MPHPRYDTLRTYQWNYDHAPDPLRVDEPPVPGRWTFCGRGVPSPLGVAAGPLLNGRWCLYYAALGFDVVTYKTVRTGERACYPLPNLLGVPSATLHGGERDLTAAESFDGSWAISFGMPSKPPAVWQDDVAHARRELAPEKLLGVSVVGTAQPGWSVDQLADDYAQCAAMAAASGADSIEINLSCPNVASLDGQLYQQPEAAATVARRVREAIGAAPLLAKIGHFQDETQLPPLLDALAEPLDAIVTTNCVAATVVNHDGRPAFDGQPRGIGGRAILDASVRQTELIAEYAERRSLGLRVIGVGGVFTAADARRYLDAGAEGVHLATGIMVDPEAGLKIREALGG